MKIWRKHFLFLPILMCMAAAGSTLAQDAGMSDVEIVEGNDPAEGEKVVYAPGEEVRYIPKAPGMAAGRDSIALHIHDFPMQQATLRPSDKPNEKQPAKSKDDSILTFNFLYYIIQKYKLQDIID
ncbi:MAG: hypothetical protein WD824_26190 [Cyclobacteriaceae bacterium]